jgi:hypothetical protein
VTDVPSAHILTAAAFALLAALVLAVHLIRARRRQRLVAHVQATIAARQRAEFAERIKHDLDVTVTIIPNGEAGLWRWVIFDAEPDYQSSRVEGVLVPYAINDKGTETLAEALREADRAVRDMSGWQVVAGPNRAEPDPKHPGSVCRRYTLRRLSVSPTTEADRAV